MSDHDDDSLSREEQERLYRERERTRNDGDCDPTEMTLVPDIDPVIPAEKCADDEETLSSDFLDPNPVPPLPGDPNLLPAPLAVLSRAVSIECPPGQAALAGSDPSVVPPGADVQMVYLDEIAGITQSELFRLAAYTDALQEYISASLIGAIDTGHFSTFDAEIVSISNTTFGVAASIRAALVAAQERADQIARTIAVAGLVCGWLNQPLWVVCHASPPGYVIALADPGEVEKAYITAGLFSSTVSQADANAQAALSAALELSCLVTNTEQDVSCSDVGGAVSELLTLSWPVNWTKASSARNAATGAEVVTLEAQGAGTWDVNTWDDYEFNTATIALGALNGQEFMQSNQVGSPARRRLRTRVIIAAGDPRTGAPDLATANAIAYNLAVAELDCFVPNRPRIISCVTESYGSSEVSARHTGRGFATNNTGRTAMFSELLGGDPAVYGGPDYARANAGVTDYGAPAEAVDRSQAFEVYVWPGYFSGNSEEVATATAGNYGASLLRCVWMSPAHDCQCAGTPEAAAMTGATEPGQVSAKFDALLVGSHAAQLSWNSAAGTNALPRGFAVDTDYPNRVADPTYGAVPLSWPGLPAICQTGLDCLFSACKTVCCEPKPDDRAYLVNGLPNYASWAGNLGVPSDASNQSAFMSQWGRALGNAAPSFFGSCPGYASADDCQISGLDGTIAKAPSGNGSFGMPARFKYGGVLKWGNQWAEPPAPNPNTKSSNALTSIGTVKACHKGGWAQTPDPWGQFHCAEGYAESPTPIGLGEQARQNALARLDCTHISWPRHLVNCPEPSQRPFAGPVNLNVVVEANSTRDANEQLENMILQLGACRDTHSFMISFRNPGDGGPVKLELPAPTVAVGRGGCLPVGLGDAEIYEEDCKKKVDIANLQADQSSHVFIVVKCCEGEGSEPPPPEKRFILRVIPDNKIDNEIRTVASNQTIPSGKPPGRMGLPSGRAVLETLREEDPNVWYIGSFSVANLGNGKKHWAADRIVAQAHVGPIVIDNSCCAGDAFEVSGNKDTVRVGASVVSGMGAWATVPVIGSKKLTDDPAPTLSTRGKRWVALRMEIKPTSKVVHVRSHVDHLDGGETEIHGIAEGGGELVPGKKVELRAYSSEDDMEADSQRPTVDPLNGSVVDNGIYVIPLAKFDGKTWQQVGYTGPLGVRMCQSGAFVALSPARAPGVDMPKVDED